MCLRIYAWTWVSAQYVFIALSQNLGVIWWKILSIISYNIPYDFDIQNLHIIY